MTQTNTNIFPQEEWLNLLRDMEKFHAVFYKMWSLGKPSFSQDTETAYVAFDPKGDCIHFVINPEFWKKLNRTSKQFVICHECLHVILNHGTRFFSNKDKQKPFLNEAMDVVVNHLLVSNYGFNRKEVKYNKELCWIDTLFPKRKDIVPNQNAEYYYNQLKAQNEDGSEGGSINGPNGQGESGQGENGPGGSNANSNSSGSGSSPTILDDHNKLGQSSEENKQIIEKLNQELTDAEKETLREMIEQHYEHEKNPESTKSRGTVGGNIWVFIDPGKVKKKKKWETVIKQWAAMKIKKECKQREQWVRVNRRFLFLDNDFFLPTEMETDEHEKEKDKIDVWFFQDTSGSCYDLAERFFTAARSLPEERFNIRMFCFDTNVYETSLKSGKLYGFGGTSFSILEEYIQREIRNSKKIKYPQAVFVITDGYGDNIKPAYPQKWYWFLSTNCKTFIDPRCNTFNLSNFE